MPGEYLRRSVKAWAFGFGIVALLPAIGAAAAPIFSQASATAQSQVQPVTFWGRPYPYGYAYHHTKWDCFVWRRIETPEGWRYVLVPVCGNAVVGRY